MCFIIYLFMFAHAKVLAILHVSCQLFLQWTCSIHCPSLAMLLGSSHFQLQGRDGTRKFSEMTLVEIFD
ncbi:hypothetical protein GLYMA_03G257401v4 [Glycine max]|nr:hypothetical protein GLYMA_03G257401v4 [Glycine max]KAG4394224.1 hypothetical protein GLYMA_03G257401v4 [Glycine max]KAG4394225.1 hypothetical protein GLYMA_03G257401v4 [Glycine max]KAH1071853.1 hypothetical protein GYH30_008377 [Glycine max]KAH1071854.1 hypothetical protein GYH30_008377 [Glycine max]